MKKTHEIAGELWRCIKADFEKEGVKLPDTWNGVGMAYGGYARAIEILDTLSSEHAREVEEAVKKERERIIKDIDEIITTSNGEYSTALKRIVIYTQSPTPDKQ